MKFRTDFVTNSSSTSYISVTLEFLDGRSIKFYGDESEDPDLIDSFKIKDGRRNSETPFSTMDDVLKAVYELYTDDGMFPEIFNNVKAGLEQYKDQEDIFTKLIVELRTSYDSESPEFLQDVIFDFRKKLMFTTTVEGETYPQDEDF